MLEAKIKVVLKYSNPGVSSNSKSMNLAVITHIGLLLELSGAHLVTALKLK